MPQHSPSGPIPRRPRIPAELVSTAVASVVATQVKTLAEGALQPWAQRVWTPSDSELTLAGADPSDHPANMPPHVMVEKLVRAVGHEPVSDHTRDVASEVIHWATGIGAGLTYGLLARRFPAVRRGRGVLFGAALWAATHGSLLPAIDIQAPLAELPRAWWVWEPGSHLVFGVVLDAALRVGEEVARHA